MFGLPRRKTKAAHDEERLRSWQREADALVEAKRYRDAIPLYERILERVPHDLYVIFQLAGALEAAGELVRAAEICDRGLALSPEQAGLLGRRAGIARRQHQYLRALETYRALQRLHPEYEYIDALIADSLALLGRGAEAVESLNRALELAPNNARIQSDRLFMLNYFGLLTREQLFDEHRKWGAAHEAVLRAEWLPHTPSCGDARKLRVGYMSADLRRHAVAFFIEGVLKNHDHSGFEIHAFDASPFDEDDVTRRLRGYCDEWHRVGERTDDEIAELVRSRQIDVLVDLSGHTAHNRLLVFARRPAPIQVSWFGYMNTTGLSSIDYRLTDEWLDPPGRSERFYTEELFRIPNAACFQPDPQSPPVGKSPALRNGYVTFASLNQWTKVTEATKDLWCRIMLELPAARLLVVARGGEDSGVQASIAREFNQRGVADERIRILGFRPLDAFLSLLNSIDLALDPFPYGGGTTTLHSAWMGVPIVTLETESELGRSTPGILRAMGLHELVACDLEQYLRIAIELARDSERLARYRRELRDRFQRSPIVDAVPLTRSVEAAFREMWRRHCARSRADASVTKAPR